MAESLWRRTGKILTVIDLARKHTDALRLDLLSKGQRLSTCDLDWDDMYAMFAAAPPNSALHYAINEGWSLTDHLQATQLDRINLILWTKTKDAHKKPPRNLPKRIPRPGVEERSKQKLDPGGGKVINIMEFMKRQEASGALEAMKHRR